MELEYKKLGPYIISLGRGVAGGEGLGWEGGGFFYIIDKVSDIKLFQSWFS